MRPNRKSGQLPRARRQPRRLQFDRLEGRVVLSNGSPTVGVYDENVIDPNTVDYVATGSGLSNADFTGRVATAFAQDSGDVIDASALGSLYGYGAHQNKSLAVATDFGIGSAYHISGTGGFASSGNSATLGFSSISGGVPNEHVVALGVTALSISGRDYGNVTATARLAGGGTLSATRHINDATNAGDTFYGLTAPSIASDTSGPRCAARLSNVPGA